MVLRQNASEGLPTEAMTYRLLVGRGAKTKIVFCSSGKAPLCAGPHLR
jgi:hypothetical protein